MSIAQGDSSRDAAAVAACAEAQTMELEVLQCVYDDDITLVRAASPSPSPPTSDTGRVEEVAFVLARTVPAAYIFTPQERADVAACIATARKHGNATIEYAQVPTGPAQVGGGDGAPGGDKGRPVEAVPVGFLFERPLLVTVRFTVPVRYPQEPLRGWFVDAGGRLQRSEEEDLLTFLKATSADLLAAGGGEGEGDRGDGAAVGAPVMQPLLEGARSRLLDQRRDDAEYELDAASRRLESGEEADEDGLPVGALLQCGPLDGTVLGRRCIFFHHILSTYKRRVIAVMARRLGLQGFCKIGYPGVLVVEGTEDGCRLYVQLLQRLRWKLMVVRGEETIPCPRGVDAQRAIRHADDGGRGAAVWETLSSEEIASWCRDCHLEALFRTSMKIYS